MKRLLSSISVAIFALHSVSFAEVYPSVNDHIEGHDFWSKVAFLPENGVIGEPETAVAVAVAIWSAIYGPEAASYPDYSATLSNGIWHVTGSLPEGHIGGVPYARIKKSNGKVLGITHSQ